MTRAVRGRLGRAALAALAAGALGVVACQGEPEPGPSESAFIGVAGSRLVLAEQQKLFPSGDGGSALPFGRSVAIHGDLAVVGAGETNPLDNSLYGVAHVFVRGGGGWTQQAKLQSGAGMDNFARSVAADVDRIAIGAPRTLPCIELCLPPSAIFFFTRSGTTWAQEAKFSPSGASDFFAMQVSLDGDVALGLEFAGPRALARTGATWAEEAQLVWTDKLVSFSVGSTLSGNTALVGVHSYTASPGFVDVWVRQQGAWTTQTRLWRNSSAVSIDGDTALIGVPSDSAAYVYVRNGTFWSEQALLMPSDGVPGDSFGISVAISGDVALVGSAWSDVVGLDSGAAYVFHRHGTTWTEYAKLVPSDGAPGDHFGTLVSLSNGTALIGVPDKGANNGAAYVFEGLLPEPVDAGEPDAVEADTALDYEDGQPDSYLTDVSFDTAVEPQDGPADSEPPDASLDAPADADVADAQQGDGPPDALVDTTSTDGDSEDSPQSDGPSDVLDDPSDADTSGGGGSGGTGAADAASDEPSTEEAGDALADAPYDGTAGMVGSGGEAGSDGGYPDGGHDARPEGSLPHADGAAGGHARDFDPIVLGGGCACRAARPGMPTGFVSTLLAAVVLAARARRKRKVAKVASGTDGS